MPGGHRRPRPCSSLPIRPGPDGVPVFPVSRLQVVGEASAFPGKLAHVQAGDDGSTISAMGRGALAVNVTEPDARELVVVAVHLKSRLLSFPPGPGGKTRFNPRDEGERARVAHYALSRRSAEAVTVRPSPTSCWAATAASTR